MRYIFMTMAAVSALGLAVPAAGQPWSGRSQGDSLQSRIGPSGDRRPDRQERDARDERKARWGESTADRAAPRDRDPIELYARWDDGSAGRKPLGTDMSRPDDRFDRAGRGDRFVGDVRVGQAASPRMTEIPERYRARFADDERVYYRYDDRRVYQVDRRNGLVLGLLDMVD